MSPYFYLLMVVPVAGAVGLFIVLSAANDEQETDELRERRIATYVGTGATAEAVDLPGPSIAEVLRSALRGTAGQRIDRSTRGRRLAIELAQADLKLRTEEWIGIVIGSVLLGAALVYLRFGSPIAAAVGAVLGYLLPGRFRSFRRKRRIRKFESGLGETVMTLSNALRAGYAFSAAMRVVAESAPYPLDAEFARIVSGINLGVPVEDALDSMVKRNGSEDVEMLVTAVKINRAVGGNLAEILDTIEGTIRGRVQLKGEIRTLTAQARASGWIITLLPVGLAGLLTLISPTYFTPMFHKTIGLIMLGVAGFMISMGALIIKKIVNISM